MNRFKKEFLAWAILMVSVYLLTIFLLVHVLNLDTPKPVTVVVTVVVVETPTPVPTIPQEKPPTVTPCHPAKTPSKKPTNRPQIGGYTGTVVVPYSQPIRYVPPKRARAKPVYHPILYHRKLCVHHHRHHHHKHRCHHHKHKG